MLFKFVFLLMCLVAVLVQSAPLQDDSDSESAASGDHHHGRVQIKVYRGPSDGQDAPWGFWVKQPADD